MRFPWVNAALLAAICLQLLTGFLGLINGNQDAGWILRMHDVGGSVVIVLSIWKAAIIFDAFKRKRRINYERAAFVILTILLIMLLVTGFAWPILGYTAIGGFSLMTIHALTALGLVTLFGWHVVAKSYVLRSPKVQERRAFIKYLGIIAAGAFAWQAYEWIGIAQALPGAFRRFTGSFANRSFTGSFPTVSWLFDLPSPIDSDHWQLSIEGSVAFPFHLTYAQISTLALDTTDEIIDCTGGWYSAQTWSGVRLNRLLERATVLDSAQSVAVEAVSGYSRSFPLDDAKNMLLATHVAGRRLDYGHGFPLRLVAPGHRGFEWVKWIVVIRVQETNHLLQPPLPLQ